GGGCDDRAVPSAGLSVMGAPPGGGIGAYHTRRPRPHGLHSPSPSVYRGRCKPRPSKSESTPPPIVMNGRSFSTGAVFGMNTRAFPDTDTAWNAPPNGPPSASH